MEYVLPSDPWGHGSRGFWTKRKKTATSLLSILALIAGIAVAFKLFDREVPNNVVRDASIFDYDIHVERTPAQGCTSPVSGGQWCNTLDPGNPNAIFAETLFVLGSPQSVNTYPGDTRVERVRIINTHQNPAKDASFQVHIDPASIVVERCTDADGSGGTSSGDFDDDGECLGGYEVVPAGQDRTRFINFWTLRVDREQIMMVLGEPFKTGGMSESCQGGLSEFNANAPCDLGRVWARGTENVLSEPMDVREYDFRMTELDDGTDQSAFKGWKVTWTFVFNARVPALPVPETGTA